MIPASALKKLAQLDLTDGQYETVIAMMTDIERATEEKAAVAIEARRAADRVRKQRQRGNASRDVTGQVTDGHVTSAMSQDVTGQKKEDPQTPKEKVTPPPSPPKGGSVGAPRGAGRSRATRLSSNWQPNEIDRAFARKHGFDDASIDLETEKIRNWSATSPKGACLDWPARWRNWILQAGPPARAGPADARGPTLAEMSRMDEPGFAFDDPKFRHSRSHDFAAERPGAGESRGNGFAGRLPLEDRDDRRHRVVDL